MTNPHRPHPHGDCDACGNPDDLPEALEAEAERLGISLETRSLNSWDLSIGIGGRDAARLILALRQVHTQLDHQETEDLLLSLVKDIDAVGG